MDKKVREDLRFEISDCGFGVLHFRLQIVDFRLKNYNLQSSSSLRRKYSGKP